MKIDDSGELSRYALEERYCRALIAIYRPPIATAGLQCMLQQQQQLGRRVARPHSSILPSESVSEFPPSVLGRKY